MKYIKSKTVFCLMLKRQNRKLALCFRIDDVVIYNRHQFYIY